MLSYLLNLKLQEIMQISCFPNIILYYVITYLFSSDN